MAVEAMTKADVKALLTRYTFWDEKGMSIAKRDESVLMIIGAKHKPIELGQKTNSPDVWGLVCNGMDTDAIHKAVCQLM